MPPPTSDRRRFLAGSSALMLAGATSFAALAQDSAEKPVRVAVVGTGARGCDLIRALTTIDRAKLVALCDDHEPHLMRGAE